MEVMAVLMRTNRAVVSFMLILSDMLAACLLIDCRARNHASPRQNENNLHVPCWLAEICDKKSVGLITYIGFRSSGWCGFANSSSIFKIQACFTDLCCDDILAVMRIPRFIFLFLYQTSLTSSKELVSHPNCPFNIESH